MEYFSEYGVDIDAMQAADNEAYMNRNRALRVVTESVDAADLQSSDNLKVDKDVGNQVGKKIGIMKPIPVDELMLTWEPTEWIVDLFGAKGACVLLAGDKGSGKSVFMYRMAEALQKGEPFMTELQTKQSKVFIWQADESRNNAKAKIKLMELKGEFSYLFNDDEYGNYLDINVLKKTIQQNNYQVVFIDSVTGLLMGNGVNIKDSEFCKPLYELNNLASELNILIVISAHLTKDERREVNMNDILGAGTQGGAVSDVWGLWSHEDDDELFYLKCLGKRNCEKGIFWKLQGNREDYSFKLIEAGDGDILPDKKTLLGIKVLEELMSKKERLTYQELAKEINCNDEHARRICIKLFTEGKIERQKIKGSYGRPFYRYYFD